jgi:hypothetical protein
MESKKPEINLKLETVHVEAKVRKLRCKVHKPTYEEAIHDIHPDAAKTLGFTQNEYRRKMNSEKVYNEYFKDDLPT